MTEPTDCASCRALAPELALGIATGRERADTLAHLERCPACRAELESLTRVQDALRTLSPAHDPPAGFESRVLARLPQRRRRRRTYAPVAAAAAALVAVGGMGGVLIMRPAAVTTSEVRVADVVAAGQGVGRAFAYAGSPSWLYMYLDLDGPRTAGPVTCTVTNADGTRVVAGTFTLSGGDAYWGGPVGTADVTSVQVTDPSGAVVASASFPAGVG